MNKLMNANGFSFHFSFITTAISALLQCFALLPVVMMRNQNIFTSQEFPSCYKLI